MGKPLEHIVRCRPLKPRKDEQDIYFSEKQKEIPKLHLNS